MQDDKILLELHKLLPRKDLWDVIVKEPVCGLTQEQCLLYIVGIYHYNSPLEKIIDARDRKVKLVKILQIEPSQDIVDILTGANKAFNQYILIYTKFYKSTKHTKLKMYYDQLYAEYSNLQNVDSSETLDEKEKADAKKKITVNIDYFSDEIDKLTSEFLSGDNSEEIIKDMFQDILIDDAMFPEDIGFNIRDGKGPLGDFNPYL